MSFPSRLMAAAALASAASAAPQVHHHPSGQPWSQRASSGPDAECPGWFYNLGVTGIRVRLVEDAPTVLRVGHVLSGSPAEGRLQPGDDIVGVGGQAFETPHRNGYGMDVFGPTGPIEDFAKALDAALSDPKSRPRLALEVRRGDRTLTPTLALPRRSETFGADFPFDDRSAALLERLRDHLAEQQRDDGSFGNPVHDTFAPLALLGSKKAAHRKAALKNARYHARTTSREDDRWLVNWHYTSAALVLSEVHLATGDRKLLPELEEIRDFLLGTQYLDLSQVNPKVKESHPDSYPKNGDQQHGGWGHNPGFEGYGPIAMITGQAALGLAMIERCGIDVPDDRQRAAYAFLKRGSGSNGYLWYGDSAAGDRNWADMGRTGASAIAHWMSPFEEDRPQARLHAAVMSEHPESFPDTHGSPLMGMGFGALGASVDPERFAEVIRANRWWFVLAECPDGTFHYQPNRDNAGYGPDARLLATAVTAFILSIPEGRLEVTEQFAGKR